MKRLLCVTFVLMMGATVFGAVPLIQAGKGPSPTIDGKLDDAGWSGAARLFPFFENQKGRLPKAQTEARVFYDDRALYVGFACDEPFMDNLVADSKRRDDKVWLDDDAEVFFRRPGAGAKEYYHVSISNAAVPCEAYEGRADWDPTLQAATSKGADRWYMELAIPWDQVGGAPKPGEVWGFNVTRQRQGNKPELNGEKERSAWSATMGTFLNPERFGEIVFADTPFILDGIKLDEVKSGANVALLSYAVNGKRLAGLSVPEGSRIATEGDWCKVTYPVGLADRDVIFEVSDGGRIVWRCAFRSIEGPGRERALLDAAAANIEPALIRLKGQAELRQAVEHALVASRGAGDALGRAMAESVATGTPISDEDFAAMRKAVCDAGDALEFASWRVWAKSNWTDLARGELPPDAGETDRLSFTTVVNEYASGNVIITNLGNKPLRLRVTAGDMAAVEADGARTVFQDVAPSLAVADWQELRKRKVVADPLVPMNVAGRIDIPSGESRQVWITFPARDLPPGEYECELLAKPLATIQRNGSAPSKKVTLAMSVKPLRIATYPDFAVYNWDYARNEHYIRNLMDHKVTFFLIGTAIPSPDYDADGNPFGQADFTEYDRMLRIKIDAARKTGGQVMFSYGLVEALKKRWEEKPGLAYCSPAWNRAFRHAVTGWLAHIKAMGLDYGDFCVQAWDEATDEEVDQLVKVGALLREVDPKVRWIMDGGQSVEEIRRIDGFTDAWIPHLPTLQHTKDREALCATYHELQKRGEPVYAYTCDMNMKASNPYVYHRLKPWWAAHFKMDGVFYWDYNSWRGDPWDDFDGPIADCGVVYDAGNGVIDSRRWEASREGIEDWQILRLTQRLAAEQGAEERIAPRITEILDGVIHAPKDLTKAETAKVRLIDTALELAAAAPLQAAEVRSHAADRELTVSFTTNRPASGVLYYCLKGTTDWRPMALSLSSAHVIRVALPPLSSATWRAVLWDETGRVVSVREIL